ncbi:hypothetical protein [Pseudomonas sp.]|uniref:hypothetical protein n=1 Tax=Pseudomonas sp. TaxID=306 RepID=UPI00290D8C07|nr:hypothetical protein [Pseudomonas sp.]MDU4254485.1 hypothetical protein [Pseudomonas sp.]
MVKVVDLKERAIERLEGYRDDPRCLPGLVHARYRSTPTVPTKGGKTRRIKPMNFALRNHKPHQMHAQHRNSCVKVLQWLVKKMDVMTMQCVFVNPRFGIRRTVYVPEIADKNGMCERTVTRVLGSLVRGGYLLRTLFGKEQNVHHFYLTEKLFRDLKLDISLNVLVRRMRGLEKKDQPRPAKPGQPSKPNAGPAPAPKPADDPGPSKPKEPSAASLSLGNSFLDALRKRRPKPPG